MSFPLPSEQIALVAKVDPDANAAGALTSDWVPVKDFHQFMAIFSAGTLGSSATFNGKIQQATDDSGTDAEDITGKAITALTQAGTDQSDEQAVINLNADEVGEGFTHIAIVLTTGVATSDGDAELWGLHPRYGPASDHDLDSVVEIIT